MMKKLFVLSLACLLIGLLATPTAKSADLKTYVISNDLAYRADALVPLTTLIPGKDWVLGFRITANNASCVDPTIELHDAASTATMSSSTQFDSLEANTSPLLSDGDWYPGGKKISLGLAIRQGGYTDVTIFYERRIN